MNTAQLILARKYAQAFVNLFKERLSVDDIIKIKDFINYFKTHRQALFYLQLTSIEDSVKLEALKKVRKYYNLITEFDELFVLLLKDKRITIIALTLGEIIELYENTKNILEFEFIYSHELGEKITEKFKKFLEVQTGKCIYYGLKIDKKLIAGVRLHSDTLLWEYSVCKQLKNLDDIKLPLS